MAGLKWIPIDMIQEVLRKRLITSFKIYVIMNIYSNGYLNEDKDFFYFLKIHSDIKSIKTLRRHIYKLVELKWIGHNDGTYYVRSIWWINNVHLNLKTSRRVEFHKEYLKVWKGYLTGSFIGYLAYVQKLKAKAEIHKGSGLSKRDNPYQQTRISASYPVAHKGIEKILCVSISTAHELKLKAKEAEFIYLRNDFQEVKMNPQDLTFARMNAPEFHKCIIRHGIVYERKPDQVQPLLKYKGGKKSKYIRRDYKGK